MKKIVQLKDADDWEKLKEECKDNCEIVIFKYSPVCSISFNAENEFDKWFEILPSDKNITAAKIDVIYHLYIKVFFMFRFFRIQRLFRTFRPINRFKNDVNNIPSKGSQVSFINKWMPIYHITSISFGIIGFVGGFGHGVYSHYRYDREPLFPNMFI